MLRKLVGVTGLLCFSLSPHSSLTLFPSLRWSIQDRKQGRLGLGEDMEISSMDKKF
jgi:hypothetical protein